MVLKLAAVERALFELLVDFVRVLLFVEEVLVEHEVERVGGVVVLEVQLQRLELWQLELPCLVDRVLLAVQLVSRV